MLEKFKAAFGAIAYYNGHEEWLWRLSDNLRSSQDATYPCPLPTEEWCSDKHALWMMLVGVFGEWGTSIRSGWIEDKEGAAAFIDEVTDRYAEGGLTNDPDCLRQRKKDIYVRTIQHPGCYR